MLGPYDGNLANGGERLRLVDAWGNEYYLRFDADDDGKIDLPAELGGGSVSKKVIGWSKGEPNAAGQFGGGDQWITSW